MLRAVPLSFAAAIVFGLIFSPTAWGNPLFQNITPRGGERGTEVEVQITGRKFEDAQELIIYEPGVTVTQFEVVKPNEIKAKLMIAADCPIGPVHFRVRSDSGMSEMKIFRVGQFPSVKEVEPNSDFQAPQAIAPGVTIDGAITNEDVDYFVLEMKKGDRLSAEIEALRLGDTFFDPYIAILNEDRFDVATRDDCALLRQDGFVSVIIPADGKYILEIRESSYGNGSQYRCHVGYFPRPSGVFPAGGKPGETRKFAFLGDPAGPIEQEMTLPKDATDDYQLIPGDARGTAPSGLSIRVNNLENTMETGTNHDLAKATLGPVPGAFNGILAQPKEEDFFKFEGKKGQVFDIHVYARRLRSSLDPVLTILNDKGGQLANNDDTGGPDSYIRFTLPADGVFALKVHDHLHRGGPDYFYRLEVTPVQPVLALSINEFVQFQEDRLVVYQGSRTPILLTATRRDFGGPLQFLAQNLPAGVTLESYQVSPDQSQVQLILSAAADAPLAFSRAQIEGKLVDEKRPEPITALLTQDCVQVRGQNNRPFFVEPVPSLVISVAKPVPYSVRIEEPKVPIAQNGSMRLKIVAERAEGFDKPINLQLVTNPPNVSSSQSSRIEAGKNETFIDINANANAPVGEYRICVRAVSETPLGNAVVASPFAMLKVSEPFVKFDLAKSAIEQGQEIEMPVQLEQLQAFEGNATVKLVGLPTKVTAEPVEINKETKTITFKVKAEADAPQAMAKNLFCEVTVVQNGEAILHRSGQGHLRVDKPLPPKNVAAAPPVQGAPQPAQPAAPRPLSRLEQLRQQSTEKKEAEKK